MKYGILPTDDAELGELNERLVETLNRTRPFLDPDFSLAELAALLGISERQTSQLVNARHGMNIAAYINLFRVDFAAQLLLGSDKPIKAIPVRHRLPVEERVQSRIPTPLRHEPERV